MYAELVLCYIESAKIELGGIVNYNCFTVVDRLGSDIGNKH